MYILGIHVGRHDSATCLFKDQDLVSFCKEERLTREKNCGKKFKLLGIDEVLRIAGITRKDVDVVCLSRYHIPASCFYEKDRLLVEKLREFRGKESNRKLFREMAGKQEYDETKIINLDALRKFLKVRRDTEISFSNHHYAHILGLLKYTTWPDEALFVSCDGGGDYAYYVAYYLKDNKLECLCGADLPTFDKPQNEGASIGLAYCSVTELLGFRPNRHEGKITGLAAFGKPVAGEEIRNFFKISPDGTARPQIVYREDNPLYYDILVEFKKLTGIPCLVNTSFNVHEEPIINTPEEALKALRDNRIDFLVCDKALIDRENSFFLEAVS